MGGGRSGYEYSYSLAVDGDIIPLYPSQAGIIGKSDKGFLFEIRTCFKLKKRASENEEQMMVLGSERFAAGLLDSQDEWWLNFHLTFRLKDDYWMSDDEIQQLIREALDFAKQRASENPEKAVIPVVVGLDVCTVQRDGELVNDAVDRAIGPHSLVPVYVWPVVPKDKVVRPDEGPYLDRKSLLWELSRVRVEDEAGLALMEVCPVCCRASAVGAQISLLPGCNHACHSRCVFEWLRMGRSSCPSCGARIPTDSDRDSDSDSEI